MNMSIKVCVPHHASSQKHLLISTLEALLPELSRARERGLLVTAPLVPASPCWSHGEGSLPPFLCLPHHLQRGTTWDVKPQVPSWLCKHPSKPKGRPAGAWKSPHVPPPLLWPGMLRDVGAAPPPPRLPHSPQGPGFG